MNPVPSISMSDIDKVMSRAADVRRNPPHINREGEARGSTPVSPISDGANWPKRLPLDSAGVAPAFPIETILPAPARQFLIAVAETFSVPIDLPALAWLALAGGCATYRGIGGVVIDEGWTEKLLSLYAIVALPSGTRKSAVFTMLTEPVREFERHESEVAAPEVARKKTEIEIKKKTLARLQAQAADDPAVAVQAGQLAEEIAVMPEPALPRLLADDVTPEVLIRLMANQGGKMIVASAECDLLAVFQGRYADRGGANLGVFLKAASGDEIIVDRIGRPPERIPSPALSLLLCGQPEALGRMLVDRTLRDRGLIGRFLYAVPPSPLGSRPIDTPAVPRQIREEYAEMMGRMLRAPFVPPVPPEWDEGAAGGGTGGTSAPSGPWMLTFSSEARVVLRPLQSQVEISMGPGGDFQHHSGWASKLPGTAARIAGILTMAEDPTRTSVGAYEAQAAVNIARWAMAHAKVAFQAAGADPDVEIAKRLHGWLQRKRPATFTRRDAFQALKGGGGSVQRVADIRGALAVLVDHGHVVAADVTEHEGRGRDRGGAAMYLVHPEITGDSGR